MANDPPFSGPGNDLNNPINPADYVNDIEDNLTKIKDEIIGVNDRLLAATGPSATSFIEMQDDGLVVPNSPFDKINFIGPLLEAADGGGGVVNVSSSGLLTQPINTGLTDGGTLSINGGDPTKFDISAGNGIIADYTAPNAPVFTTVSWLAMSLLAPTGLGSDLVTYVAINAAGGVVQQTSDFTPTQRRTLIVLGLLFHPGASITVAAMRPTPTFSLGMEAQDFTRIFGPINNGGNTYSANGANLRMNKSIGEIFAGGSQFALTKQNTAIATVAAQAPAPLVYAYQDGFGGFTFEAATLDVTPARYDDGTGTPAAVLATEWTIQRIFLSPLGFSFIALGQQVFATQALAKAAIGSAIALPEEANQTVLRAWLLVRGNATDLSDPAQAAFISAGRLGLTDVAPGTLSGEVNTGANIGVDGVGVFASKSGPTLQFRNVAPANPSVTTVLNGDDIDIDVAAATETLQGKIELATQVEVDAGADDLRAITPLKLANASGLRFGKNYQSASSLGLSTTTSALYQTKLALTTPALAAGTYRIGWSATLGNSSFNGISDARLQNITDAVTLQGPVQYEPESNLDQESIGGFATVVFAGVAKTFEIQYRALGGNTARILDARLEIWRVS